jgi:hypothetical protein
MKSPIDIPPIQENHYTVVLNDAQTILIMVLIGFSLIAGIGL